MDVIHTNTTNSMSIYEGEDFFLQLGAWDHIANRTLVLKNCPLLFHALENFFTFLFGLKSVVKRNKRTETICLTSGNLGLSKVPVCLRGLVQALARAQS